MKMEEKLQGAKKYSYQKLVLDVVKFEQQIMNRLEREQPKKRKLFGPMKVAMLLASVLLFSLAGVAYGSKEFLWFGTHYSQSENNKEKNLGTNIGSPNYETLVVDASTTSKYTLEESHLKAKFPIRVPVKISNWKRVRSEGLIYPHTDYKDGKLVKLTTTPLEYYEVYTNEQGQRIAVLQKQDGINVAMAQALKKSQDSSYPNGSTVAMQLRRNATVLQGFGNDLAVFAPNVIDVSAESENFNQLVLYHIEDNDTITQIEIDEYGGVPGAELEKIAHEYLQAPIK